MSIDYDVIVVGAGPTGATCAKILAEIGYDIILVAIGNTPFKRSQRAFAIYKIFSSLTSYAFIRKKHFDAISAIYARNRWSGGGRYKSNKALQR